MRTGIVGTKHSVSSDPEIDPLMPLYIKDELSKPTYRMSRKEMRQTQVSWDSY